MCHILKDSSSRLISFSLDWLGQYKGTKVGATPCMGLRLWSTLCVSVGLDYSFLEKCLETLIRVPNNLSFERTRIFEKRSTKRVEINDS